MSRSTRIGMKTFDRPGAVRFVRGRLHFRTKIALRNADSENELRLRDEAGEREARR